MIKKRQPKRTPDTANAEDFIKPPVFESFSEDDDAGAVDIFSAPPAIIDDRPDKLKQQICSSLLDEMLSLKKVVIEAKDKLGMLAKKFFVLRNGDPLSGSYTIRFDKDNEIKNEGEMDKILYDRFIETYSLDIKPILTKVDDTMDLLRFMSRDKKASYCEVDIFAQEKKEPVQC